MKKNLIIAFIILVLFSLSFVNAIEVIEDIAGYTYLYTNDRLIGSKRVQVLRYIDEDDVTFSGVIWSSESSEVIDSLFHSRMNNQGTLDFEEYFVYVHPEGQYVFWRNGDSLIEIHSKPDSAFDFPSEIIMAYLRLYPPTCEEESCYPSIMIKPPVEFTFKSFTEVQKEIRGYSQDYLSCPNSNPSYYDITSKIRESLGDTDRFTDAEINEMILECKQEGAEVFTVGYKQKTQLMETCTNKIETQLSDKGVSGCKEVDVLAECVIQEDFRERYPDLINNPEYQAYFENLFDERIESAVNDIYLKEATHERTEDDDEDEYLQKLEQERKEEDESTFDPNTDYDVENFPEYGGETTENFLERFFNYFKRVFNLFEWQQSRENK